MERGNRSAALAIALALCVLAALPFAAAALGNPAMTTLATRILIYAIAAASLNLVLGYGGLVSFGHAAFFGIGGYTVGILFHHQRFNETLFGLMLGTDQFLITLPAAILVSGLFAAVIGALALRTAGVQFIMITLAFAQMLFFLFVALKRYGGDDGLIIRRRNSLLDFNMRDDTTFYFVTLVFVVLFFALIWRIVNSRFGLVLGGIRQSERRMAAIGISTYRYKLAAFIISGMGAGLAGALWANYARFVSPDMMHWTKSGELMVMVILGGAGTLLGPLFGSAALILLETVLAAYTERWQVFLGPILIVIILFFRGGLAGLVDLVRKRP
ncbi:MAG: branched-chain amino acid ABC transporter permease [Hyphomicrobiales bacterium]|jgi:branched-chain amino acid transport system permease protein|nr:branched-chain amino acid ABC transporter permease [Hyphomicrobiales bacterium]